MINRHLKPFSLRYCLSVVSTVLENTLDSLQEKMQRSNKVLCAWFVYIEKKLKLA